MPTDTSIFRPVFRTLRGYALDPSLAQELRTAPISEMMFRIPWEDLEPGPIGKYLEVIDYDPLAKCFYEPVDLNDVTCLRRMDSHPPKVLRSSISRWSMRSLSLRSRTSSERLGAPHCGHHTISYGLHPSVELQVNGVKIEPTMTFDVTAKLKLEGVQLVIKNAWITRVKAGKLTSTISMEYKTIPLMAPCKKTIDLPLQFHLPGGGIRLGGDTVPPPRTQKDES